MRKIFFILLVFSGLFARGQNNVMTIGTTNTRVTAKGTFSADTALILNVDTLHRQPKDTNALVLGKDSVLYVFLKKGSVYKYINVSGFDAVKGDIRYVLKSDTIIFYRTPQLKGDATSPTPLGVVTSALASGVATATKFLRGDSTWTSIFPTQQVHTTGATVTITSQTTDIIWLIVDPGSTLAALTITLPATPVDGQRVMISFGGTVGAGGTVVTSLTVSANSGQTIIQQFVPTAGTGGTTLTYIYRFANTKWYRIP